MKVDLYKILFSINNMDREIDSLLTDKLKYDLRCQEDIEVNKIMRGYIDVIDKDIRELTNQLNNILEMIKTIIRLAKDNNIDIITMDELSSVIQDISRFDRIPPDAQQRKSINHLKNSGRSYIDSRTVYTKKFIDIIRELLPDNDKDKMIPHYIDFDAPIQRLTEQFQGKKKSVSDRLLRGEITGIEYDQNLIDLKAKYSTEKYHQLNNEIQQFLSDNDIGIELQ